MSSAAQRTQERKAKILAKSADRLALAKGEKVRRQYITPFVKTFPCYVIG